MDSGGTRENSKPRKKLEKAAESQASSANCGGRLVIAAIKL